MIVSIHQPAYLPWLGYFDKIHRSDVFVYLDTVQFQKGSFQNRNKIKTNTGWKWLTVPVYTKGKLFDSDIKSMEIHNELNWKKKHEEAIFMNYKKSAFFNDISDDFLLFYSQEWKYLNDLCYEMMLWFNKKLNINTKILKASEISGITGSKSDLILNICKKLECDTYLSGIQGKNYLSVNDFKREDIKVTFQNYKHPVYTQLHGEFEYNMGIIDLIANEEKCYDFFN